MTSNAKKVVNCLSFIIIATKAAHCTSVTIDRLQITFVALYIFKFTRVDRLVNQLKWSVLESALYGRSITYFLQSAMKGGNDPVKQKR